MAGTERFHFNRSQLPLVAVDAAGIFAAAFLAELIRFDGRLDVTWPRHVAYWDFALVAALLRLAVYFHSGMYHRLWRYAGIEERKSVFRAAVIAAAANGSLILLFFRDRGMSRGVWLIASVLSYLFLSASRHFIAAAWERRQQGSLPQAASFPPTSPGGEVAAASETLGRNPLRTLIIGAGDAGLMTVRELLRHPQLGHDLVGFIDDDPGKLGLELRGLPVLGTRRDLAEVVRRHGIQKLIIAMPTASGQVVREILEQGRNLSIQVQTVPGLFELMSGSYNISRLREVRIEDLLRRNEVKLNLAPAAAYLSGRTVLVTGAGGSIGSELCRQIAYLKPKHLLLLGRGENSIFEIQQELSRTFPQLHLTPIIADIRDAERLDLIFARHKPEVVFHAAAHKHVPLMEENPEEAITNNILGTANCVDAAAKHRVERFVMISTDKAVRPVSVMGASKRVAEMVVQSAAGKSQTRFSAVRFGNVLGSRGSVTEIFKRQIERGGPVTVTDPEMRRYFMTIPEAVRLVIQAGALGEGGEVYLLDMGEPIRIVDLAHDMIRLSGYKPDVDIPIVFTGSRPGEKLFEELHTDGEDVQATANPRIVKVRCGEVDERLLARSLRGFKTALAASDPEAPRQMLLAIAKETSSLQQSAC